MAKGANELALIRQRGCKTERLQAMVILKTSNITLDV